MKRTPKPPLPPAAVGEPQQVRRLRRMAKLAWWKMRLRMFSPRGHWTDLVRWEQARANYLEARLFSDAEFARATAEHQQRITRLPDVPAGTL